jgi:hypothetical protein
MVAFLLPITWALTGATALGTINKVGQWLGLWGLVLDDWKLRKCQTLGITPESISQILTESDTRRLQSLLAIGAYRHFGQQHIFSLDDEWVRKHGLAGDYCLLDRELSYFRDGVRHLELLDGVGDAADHLRELIKGTNLRYEDFSFLWEDFDCDFARLRKLSKERIEQPEWFEAARWLMARRVSKV